MTSLRSVDRDLLCCLRDGQTWTVGELIETLGVTSTAVRQRIERLLAVGLVQREKQVAGRGRPSFRYQITVQGHREIGADSAELAEAMWKEILSLPDETVRTQLIDKIAKRLGRQFSQQIQFTSAAATSPIDDRAFAERIEQLSGVLRQREIAADVDSAGQLPVLDIEACPYPNMTDTSEDRSMCRLEQQMLSEALGRPVHLSSCRLDGDACCQFEATPSAAVS